ncbi:hypothetical protein [Streptomyces sp. SAJ15]|uniref:hypothetical protein n=1 Tax=Streptomyces sp. SAJ15 TaxID=2011095 RepID=UPI0011864398|nr:hypothetical protein [Streptomyces sp. SAJ15]
MNLPFDQIDEATARSAAGGAELPMFDPTFPARVAVLMRSRPIADAAAGGVRQDWPDATYDVATLALAAIDMIIARQGFEDEASYRDVIAGLADLARRAAPGRSVDEHEKVAAYTLDALLNRAQREAPFTYRISDYGREDGAHQQRQVQFRLLIEREDPVRGEVVLNATRDAVNALVGGLEFDVEDEQVANELMLERQLAKGAFAAAEKAAVRARLLSVSLADDLNRLIKDTRRDLRSVLEQWANDVPERLDAARDHISARLESEHRLLVKVRESLDAEDEQVTAAAARIAGILTECARRHEALHRQVITARGVFLEEQNRQAFRPPAGGYLPDLGQEVLQPLLGLDTDTARTVVDRWLSDITGPRPVKLPRLYRLLDDLWAARGPLDETRDLVEAEEEIGDPDPPTIPPEVITAAQHIITRIGLPARLSTLIASALTGEDLTNSEQRRQTAEILALTALWSYAPEELEPGQPVSADLAAQILGPRAAADTDGLPLRLPGWDGDDLIIAAHPDALETADPIPVTTLHLSAQESA